MKRPKFETKKSLFRYFWARILKNIWNQHLQISVIVRLCEKKKKKRINLGPKMSDLDIFGLEFENNIVIFEISTLEFV